MDKKEKKEGLFSRLKKVKHIEIIIAVIAVAVMLIIYFVGFGGGGDKISNTAGASGGSSIYSDYCARMQSEVTQIVSKIQGAGEAKAVINWESGVELVLAASESSSPNSNTSTPIVISGGGSSAPVVIKEIYPKAVGVVVVCEGGANAKIKVDIIMSISTLLGISSDKVVVLPMGKVK
ncbi:MAG: hypothetical protein FWE84_04805 [Firmicutes bacterium]|nr:hypothetical protein [Bacillota bacterium]